MTGVLDLTVIAEALGRVAMARDATFTREEQGLAATDLSQLLAQIDVLHSSLGALEMRTMTALDEQIRAQDAQEGARAKEQGRRTAGEIQMASRISPALASRRLRASERLVRDMPRMFEALATGSLPLEAAYAIGRSAGPIDPALRPGVDAVLDEHLPDLDGASTSRWTREVDALAQALDPQGTPRRHRRAAAERSVSVRAGAHGMGTVTAHLPGIDAAAIRRRLSLDAEGLRAAGDERTHSQLMADLFADTLIGRTDTFDPVHLDIGVVISERSLFAPAHGEPAMLEGYGIIDAGQVRDHVGARYEAGRLAGIERDTGPLGPDPDADGAPGASDPPTSPPAATDPPSPATARTPQTQQTQQTQAITDALRRSRGAPPTTTPTAQDLIPSDSPLEDARRRRSREVARMEETIGDSLRRIYTHPTTGELVAMDSRSRAFPTALARYMRIRDVLCGGPYCDAPIRHMDHIRPHAEGGATSATNGQGLCAHCNLTKEVLGRAEHVPSADGSHRVAWTTRLGARATVTPGSQTGLPAPMAPPDPTGPPRSSGRGREPWFDRAPVPHGRAHLRLMITDPDPGPLAPDPLEGQSAAEEAAMHQAAFDSFGPDEDIDELDILAEFDRLDALGRPDWDLGALRSDAPLRPAG